MGPECTRQRTDVTRTLGEHDVTGAHHIAQNVSRWTGVPVDRMLEGERDKLLRMEEGDLWDTGRMEGRETAQIEYNGKPLISGRKVFWKVRSFDSDGLPSPWSEPATFEVGLLEARDWSRATRTRAAKDLP